MPSGSLRAERRGLMSESGDDFRAMRDYRRKQRHRERAYLRLIEAATNDQLRSLAIELEQPGRALWKLDAVKAEIDRRESDGRRIKD
jgi:hypothetical protein